MINIRGFLFFFILIFHLFVAKSYSQFYYTYWTGAADSNWDNPANWNPAVVPVSGLNTQAIIEYNPLTPQFYWPSLTRDIYEPALHIHVAPGGKFYFNGFTVYCNRFASFESELYSGTGGRIVSSNQAGPVVLAFYRSTLYGDFYFAVSNVRSISIEYSTTDNLYIMAEELARLLMRDVIINGDITYSKPFSSGNPQFAVYQPVLIMNNCVISGDFLYNNQFGGQVAIDSGVIVNGKINFEHIGRNPNPGQMSQDFIFKGVSNNTPGGKIKVTGCNVARIIGDTLK